jgi:hypothetical protein
MQGVRPLVEPSGRENETGSAEASPVPEGAAHEPRQTAGSAAPGESLQALRGKPHPASDLESLDMHAGMDEPELLIDLLINIAETKARGGRREWLFVAQHARACALDLIKANETPRR